MLIISLDLVTIRIVFGLLFVFGFIYNLLISWLEKRGYDEGYTSLLVVGGVGVTVLMVGLLSVEGMVILFAAFGCSGFWMVVGSIWRHMRRRERAQRAIVDEAPRLAE